jgi:hypothetical protein
VKREALPSSVHTVRLVDAEGQSWGSMSREEYEDWMDRRTVHDEILEALTKN